MNEGQKKFYSFILERVRDGKEDDAKALLEESFGKQASGTQTAEYLQGFMSKMLALLKPDYVEEVKDIMIDFAGRK
jgi:hypothetical protein